MPKLKVNACDCKQASETHNNAIKGPTRLDSAGPVSEVGTPQTLGTLQNLVGLWEVALKLIRVVRLTFDWHCPPQAQEVAETWILGWGYPALRFPVGLSH